MEKTRVNPWEIPTAAFLRPHVGYQIGHPSVYGGFGFEPVDRAAHYRLAHPQTIECEIAREVVRGLTAASHQGREKLKRQSRAALFPQVLRVASKYVATRVDNQVHPCEIGLQRFAQRIASLWLDAIEPDDTRGETPLVPRWNRYKPICSTAAVHFKTVKPVQATVKSHINFVACDTQSRELAAMFQLERSAEVVCYARNDRLEFNLLYELFGQPHVYEPDFLVRLVNGILLILEIKGQLHGDNIEKHNTEKRFFVGGGAAGPAAR